VCDFNETWVSSQIFEKYLNIKFNENSSSERHVFLCGQMDVRAEGQHDEANSRFPQFREGAQQEFKKNLGNGLCFVRVCGQQLHVCLCSASLLFLFFFKFCFCLVFDSLVWTCPNITFRKTFLFPTSEAAESEALARGSSNSSREFDPLI
jgi:hypothetical protein